MAQFSTAPIAIGLAAILGALFAAYKGKHRPAKRSQGVSAFGWALLFLSSGRMPPPPPESQIEQDLNARKNRSQSDEEDR